MQPSSNAPSKIITVGISSLDPSHKCPLSHKPCLLCTGTATRYPKRRDIAPPICVADLFTVLEIMSPPPEQPRVAAGQTFCRRKTAPTPPINYEHYHSPCILPWTCQPRMAGYIPHIQLRQLFQPGTHAIRSSARAQRRQGSPGRRLHPSAQKYGVVSIPLKGELRHGDSLNNSHTITRGETRVMSAGTASSTANFNGSSTEPLEFLQIWIIPDRVNAPPRYRIANIAPLLKHNEISTLAPETDISIMQQAWFSWAELNRGVEREYNSSARTRGCIPRDRRRNQDRRHGAAPPDGAGITDTDSITMEALQNSTVLLMEVAVLMIGKMFRLNEENHWDLSYFQLPATITKLL